MSQLAYRSLIRPLESSRLTADAASEIDAPDRRDGLVYECGPHLQLAVEVALSTGRPLLLRGDPGTGKSSLAAFVARKLDYRYYEHVVTSTTRAQDLLWRYDTVRRLSDAQVRGHNLADADYVEPGMLWWAFDAGSATRRGVAEGRDPPRSLAADPLADLNASRRSDAAVVLIDEIDKADPDVPNGLLGPLGTTSFVVHETGARVRRPTRTEAEILRDPVSRLLIVITTNEERDLPPAFVRRCVVHELEPPDVEQLVRIAWLHFGHSEGYDEALSRSLAQHVVQLREDSEDTNERPPATAEFLDAVRACRALEVEVHELSGAWKLLEEVTLTKSARRTDGAP